jgi:hypothetical protein
VWFFANLKRIHATKLGEERIKKNLCLDVNNVVDWCREKIQNPQSAIFRRGKNWYIRIDDYELTVNAHSFTVITAHKIP